MKRTRRGPVRVSAAFLGTALAVAFAASPAAAHGGPVTIELVTADAIGTDRVNLVVSATYDDDGDPLDDGELTVVAESASGGRVEPVRMARTETAGTYTAVVAFPAGGAWTVRVTSVDPVATLEFAQAVGADPSTTTAGEPSTTADASSTTAAPGTTAAVDASSAGATGSGTADDSTSQGNTPLLIGLGVVVVVVVAGLAVLRRRSTDGDGGDDGTA